MHIFYSLKFSYLIYGKSLKLNKFLFFCINYTLTSDSSAPGPVCSSCSCAAGGAIGVGAGAVGGRCGGGGDGGRRRCYRPREGGVGRWAAGVAEYGGAGDIAVGL